MPWRVPVGIVRFLAVLTTFWLGVAVIRAQAQVPPQGEGVLGWQVSMPSGSPEYYSSPVQACARQHEVYNPGATFYGYKNYGQYWFLKQCDWCYKGYLGACWYVAPATVEFTCASGYDPVYPGSCVKHGDPVEEVRSCEGSGGSVNPVTAHPIVLLTGAKLLAATDFASPDGDLVLERSYRSRGGVAYADRAPVGLGLGWRFSFQHELSIDASFASSGRVSLKTADGASYDFVRQSDGSMVPVYAAYANAARNSDYQLAFEGAWPADLNQVRTMKTRWRLLDPQGRTWILESFDQPGLSAAFEVARPVGLTRRDGYGQSFSYGPLSELASLSDSFGRQISFTWHYATSYGDRTTVMFPAALASASVPGGGRIDYGYEPLSPADAPARPERLVWVVHAGADGTLLDSTVYRHEDERFPAQVTGIVDGRGVRTLTVTYDGRGRAVSSALADGAEAVTVSYGEATTPVTTRTVTNALGKQTIYRFRATGQGAFRLEGVDGLASDHCTGSTRSYSYDANGWVLSTTDEEGEVTSFVRDARGLPTAITRSHP